MRRIIVTLLAALASVAHADILDNAGSWRREAPESYRLGFVAAEVTDLTVFEDTTNPHARELRMGFGKCLGEQRMDTLVGVVDAYLDKNAVANTYPPVAAVRAALHDMCQTYLPQPSKK